MASTLENNSRTIHLPTGHDRTAPAHGRTAKGLRLTDLRAGESARVVRLSLDDTGCRKRLAELGLAEGMKIAIASTGDTLMVMVGSARIALSAHCAESIHVIRIQS
jgi:Fe2+ transport system protein FeoA